jgi:hypothetical protein
MVANNLLLILINRFHHYSLLSVIDQVVIYLAASSYPSNCPTTYFCLYNIYGTIIFQEMENLDFSEDEIQQQLEALGYNNIPRHRLHEFKRGGLIKLVNILKTKC